MMDTKTFLITYILDNKIYKTTEIEAISKKMAYHKFKLYHKKFAIVNIVELN